MLARGPNPSLQPPQKPALVATVFWSSAPDQAQRKLAEDVGRAITAGTYKTPVLPEAAIEALKLARNALASLERIERLIASDPPLAAKLLSLANSPVYRAAEPFCSLRAALVRMGLEQTRETLGQAVLASHVFDVPPFHTWLADLAIESTAVAIACTELAAESGAGEDYAFLAGLLHDVGKAIVLQVIAKSPLGLAAPEAIVKEIVEGEHTRAGELAARKMRLAEPLVCAISRHHEWRATVPGDAPAVLVSLARRVWAATAEEPTGALQWPELEALDLVEQQARQVIARLGLARTRLSDASAAILAAAG